jgi:hypothetical protein
MKTEKQINAARKKINEIILTPDLTNEQYALFMGMSNALVWAAGGSNETMDRLLAGEPIAAGKDSSKAITKLRSGLENLAKNLSTGK